MNFEILSAEREKEAAFNCIDECSNCCVATAYVSLTENGFDDWADDDIVMHSEDFDIDDVDYEIEKNYQEIVDQIFYFLDEKKTLFVFEKDNLLIMSAAEFCDRYDIKNYCYWSAYHSLDDVLDFQSAEDAEAYIKDNGNFSEKEKEVLICQIYDYVEMNKKNN